MASAPPFGALAAASSFLFVGSIGVICFILSPLSSVLFCFGVSFIFLLFSFVFVVFGFSATTGVDVGAGYGK